MALLRSLLLRAVTLLGVLIAVLLLLVVVLGATGFSDRMLKAAIGEEVRGLRIALAQSIRDTEKLEQTLEIRQAELVRFYELDQAWYLRLPASVLRVLTLDLGEARTLRSFSGSNKVVDIVMDRLPNTILLLTTSLMITAGIGLLVGVRLATRIGTPLDRGISYFSAISYAVPAWWLGIQMILIFVYYFHLFPTGGMYSTPPPDDGIGRIMDLLWHAILPIVTLVLVTVGPYIYVVRSMTLNVAQEDHVMVARAKGLSEALVTYRHVLRVAAPPILTGLILALTGSLGGSILVETVFKWQGMGLLVWEAVAGGTPDEAVMVALVFVFTLLYVIARLFLEILYILLDPRVRYV